MYNIYSIVILILFDIPRFSVNDLHQIQVAAPSPSSRKSYDLDDNITSNVLKFADDTKVFRRVDGDKQHLQNDLDKLVKWLMLLNFWKCKCLHTGHGNLDANFKMGDAVLGTNVKEKDFTDDYFDKHKWPHE